MTFDSIKEALSMGLTVCYKTSRYEVQLFDGKFIYRSVYGGDYKLLLSEEAKQCFIKTGGV